MFYTVKQVAVLAHITVKTLHHYHKVGLLVPQKISEAGYRLYGQDDLERLQQILYFRELDFSLEAIRDALAEDTDRLAVLRTQRELLRTRQHRLEHLLNALDQSIENAEKDRNMSTEDMFAGFDEQKWREVLTTQSDYLKQNYGYDLLAENTINANEMNAAAREATQFQKALAQMLRDGLAPFDERVKGLLKAHFDFLAAHGHTTTTKVLVDTAHFFIHDDFHRKMLEGVQTGLSYYYLIAVQAFTQQVNA